MPRTMAIDPALVAVVSDSLYRAESLALALRREPAYNPVTVQSRDASVLARFPFILTDVDDHFDATVDLIRNITNVNPDAKVIALGVIETETNVVRLAEVGVSGYVPQGASLQELAAVMRSVQNGEFACAPSITYALFSHLCRLSQETRLADTSAAVLTLREHKIVELVALNLSNKEIAARLCLSQHTVKNHVHRILKKLGVRDRNLTRHAVRLRASALLQPGKMLRVS
jgi:two-component system nitrate/nitrite response regulator NarL